jgi:hypothetical protein
MNLGLGSFVTKQFFVSPDGSRAYILAQNGTGAYFPFITAVDVLSGTSSQISLAGNAIPLSAGVSRAGDLLLVGANDNSVHVIDTQSGLDLQQVPLSFPNASLCIGPGNPATQVAIASLTISSAQQSGTNTIFAYNLQNGATPQMGQTVVTTGMSDSGNNGTFTILAVNAATSSSGTITVSNPAGVTASGQTGELARDFDGFVDDHGTWSFGEPEQFRNRRSEDIAIDRGHAVHAPVFSMRFD